MIRCVLLHQWQAIRSSRNLRRGQLTCVGHPPAIFAELLLLFVRENRSPGFRGALLPILREVGVGRPIGVEIHVAKILCARPTGTIPPLVACTSALQPVCSWISWCSWKSSSAPVRSNPPQSTDPLKKFKRVCYFNFKYYFPPRASGAKKKNRVLLGCLCACIFMQ